MVMRRRVGRPLVRTAVVGGAAYMAGSAAANKAAAQRERDTAQDAQLAQLQEQQAAMARQAVTPPPPAPPAPAGAAGRDPMEQLRQLGELKAAGVLTEEEFAAKKAELLKQI